MIKIKSEPLNGKMYHNVDIVCGNVLVKRTNCVEEDDLKSAVIWLLKNIERYPLSEFRKDIIFEAFKDVMKEGDEK